MRRAALLVELFCEELPPRALQRLGEAFAQGLAAGLRKRGLLGERAAVRAFATPRRLAALFGDVDGVAPDSAFEERLMPVSVGLDAHGEATPALRKKLAARQLAHVGVAELERVNDGKVDQLVYRGVAKGLVLQEALQVALEEAIAGLPIPKVMSYQLADGETTVRFVRPAHGLVALHGVEVVGVGVLGLQAGRVLHGHRFQGEHDITLEKADDYEARLEAPGGVMADFGKRREAIRGGLEVAASSAHASLGREADYATLLDEVTALVEMPTVYTGTYDAEFLSVPAECLVLTMRQNQKYFPLFDAAGRLTNRFLIVSNMRLADPGNIVRGNERVVRARLADARFFYETDKKMRLADRVPQLASIVYHNKLGTQLDRVERIRLLAVRIQARLPRGEKGRPYADRAAHLAKADLVTLMVGEFPELQGVMGRYYAEADGEEPSVVRAIEQHYWPRFSGDKLPTGDASVAVALADKLEAIAGMFGIGQQPTGDKDPFALRRHAIGVIRILVEGNLDLRLDTIVNFAFDVFPRGMVGKANTDVYAFMHERLRGYLREQGYTANEVESILSNNPMQLNPIPRQLAAIRAFMKLPEAESLAAANKRVANILRQAATKGESFGKVERSELREPAEIALFDRLSAASKAAKPLFERGDYEGYLRSFAVLKVPVDAFFDAIMVMVEDAAVRRGRLALLADLQREMNLIADISKLAA